ncbi:LysR family transcriptional regulator [Vibrio kyushuensis]|uniref:LysR family transcriptional regulator n=1 Tax=Vibrio kyushuensis TaxID=2910249 RepID=UPI003D0D73D1
MNNDNWQWWHYFLSIAEKGSLSKAAEQLDVSQPTLSRQLLSMEKQLGHSLFDRSTQGLTLTNFGESLVEECRQMQASAERLERLAAGHKSTLSGRVRLAANELVALYYLPKILPLFMQRYPEVSVEVEVSNLASNLDKRDADVAVRMFAPIQLDLVCRRIMEIPLGFFASSEYLAKNGVPKFPDEIFKHRVIGYDRDKQFENAGQKLGWEVNNEHFLMRTDFMPMHLEFARHHGGIVVTHKNLCFEAGLKEINAGIDLPPLPVYLACHRDVQHNKKIRVLMDFLAEHLPTLI